MSTFQEGGFVPECIRRPEIGLDLEIFNSKAAADIQERMATFNELHFYDGTLSTNLSLEEAHIRIGLMLKVAVLYLLFLYFLMTFLKGIEKRANKVRNLAGSSLSESFGSSSGSGITRPNAYKMR